MHNKLKGEGSTRWTEHLRKLREQLSSVQGTDFSAELRRKVFRKQIDELEQSQLIHQSVESLERQYKDKDAPMEPMVIKPTQTVPLDPRLHPSSIQPPKHLKRRALAQWRMQRTFQKRLEMLTHETPQDALTHRVNDIDTCGKCGAERFVDKESSTRTCSNPACGDTMNFASYIIENKDNEFANEHEVSKHQNLEHLKRFTEQYERGHRQAPHEILSKLATLYNKIHFHDASKVQPCRTNLLLKQCRDIPKTFRRASDRLSKELRAESIPEYSPQQINQLLEQRKRLRLPDDQASAEEPKQKKSFNNQIFVRLLSRANGNEAGRLHFNAKTNRIHMQRVATLEKECEAVKEKQVDLDGFSWTLHPST